MWHFHQQVVGCPLLRHMLREALAHHVGIGGATVGAYRRIPAEEWTSMHRRHKVLVGVSSDQPDLGAYWDAVRARRDGP